MLPSAWAHCTAQFEELHSPNCIHMQLHSPSFTCNGLGGTWRCTSWRTETTGTPGGTEHYVSTSIEELGSHLICVHVCCQKMAIARAGPDPAKEVNWYGYVFVFYYFTLVLPPTLWILGCTPPHIVGTGRSLPPSHHIQNLLPVVGTIMCESNIYNIDHIWPLYSWCQT